MPEVNKERKCKLGRCVVKNTYYQGGDSTVLNKLKKGVCPICDGATEEKYFQ